MLANLAVFLLAAAAPAPTAAREGPPVGSFENRIYAVSRNSLSQACSDSAKLAGEGKMAPVFAVNTCTEALVSEPLSAEDRAYVYNNRGVVQLTMMEEVEAAHRDFDAAAELQPKLAESYANRGAALVAEERFAEAIAEIDKGVAMGLKEPWKAYFNRAIAKEGVKDVRGAYEDYRKAVELKPDWALAQSQLARFQVRPAAAR